MSDWQNIARQAQEQARATASRSVAPRAVPFTPPTASDRAAEAEARQSFRDAEKAANQPEAFREQLPENRTDRRMNAEQLHAARQRREGEARARGMSLDQYSRWLRSQANITPEVQAELDQIGNQIARAVGSGAAGRERVDDLNTLQQAAGRRMSGGLSAVEAPRAARSITGTAAEGAIINPTDLENARTKDQAYGMQAGRDLVTHEAQLRQDLQNPNLSAADRRRIEAELEDIGSYNLTQGYMRGLAGAAGRTDERLAPVTAALESQYDPVTGQLVDITNRNPNVNPSWKIEDGPYPTFSTESPQPEREASGGGGSEQPRENAGPTIEPEEIEQALIRLENNPEELADWNIFDFIEGAGRGWNRDFGPRALDKRRTRNQEVADAEWAAEVEKNKMKTMADIEREQAEAQRAFQGEQAGLERAADLAQLNRQIAGQRELERMKLFPYTAMSGVPGANPFQAYASSMFGMPAYPTAGAQPPGGE